MEEEKAEEGHTYLHIKYIKCELLTPIQHDSSTSMWWN